MTRTIGKCSRGKIFCDDKGRYWLKSRGGEEELMLVTTASPEFFGLHFSEEELLKLCPADVVCQSEETKDQIFFAFARTLKQDNPYMFNDLSIPISDACEESYRVKGKFVDNFVFLNYRAMCKRDIVDVIKNLEKYQYESDGEPADLVDLLEEDWKAIIVVEELDEKGLITWGKWVFTNNEKLIEKLLKNHNLEKTEKNKDRIFPIL